MGSRERHPPGTLSWADLATTDPEAAKEFYGGVFGWQPEDLPTPGDGVYTMMRLAGRDAAALSAQMEDERSAGIPPHWNTYVTVDDVDASAERARELGAQVLAGPFDVMDAGRMAVVADPTGAVFSLWQPGTSIGAQVVNEPGAITWFDLQTNDTDAAQAFYSALFGWEFDRGEGEFPYWVIRNGERSNGGMMPVREGGPPPFWIPYFAVASLDDTIAAAKGAGGQLHAGPMDVPVGRIAVLADPQGAFFALFEGPLDD